VIAYRLDLDSIPWKAVLSSSLLRGCIQTFPDWVDNEMYTYNNKYSLKNNTKGYGGKTH
jgi:hypothetical protein